MRFPVALALVAGLAACGDRATLSGAEDFGPAPVIAPAKRSLIPTVNVAPATGWPSGATPAAAPGLRVTAFASGLDHPRWIHVLPDGDILVAETNAPPKPGGFPGLRAWVQGLFMKQAGARAPSPDRITLLRDTDRDGVADVRTVFLDGLRSPFGMALVGNDFYVANADGVMRFPYRSGATRIDAPGTPVTDLPAGRNHHWTKNLIASRDGRKLYASVGSNSNAGENGMDEEKGRAAIWEIDAASGDKRLFATGLRNPVGMAWEPETGALWVAVNERDELGSDLVPDYITSVRDGGFYGWPYSYYGRHVDTRVEPARPDLVARALVPDYALGAHTASLGLASADGATLPARFRHGMFVGQHGSWNRRPHSGYKVIFVPFADGKPDGRPVEVLTGFLDERGQARGRPVGVAVDRAGALLVADDVGNAVWRVTGEAAESGRP